MSVIVNHHYNSMMFQQDTQAVIPKLERQRLTNEPSDQIVKEDRLGGVKGCKQLTSYKSAQSAKIAYQNDGVFNDAWLSPYQQNKKMMPKYFRALINIFGSFYLLPTLQLSAIPIVAGSIVPNRHKDCPKSHGHYSAYNQLMNVKHDFMANSSSLLGTIENSQTTDRKANPTDAHIHLHTMSAGNEKSIQSCLQSLAPAEYTAEAHQMTYYRQPVYLTDDEAYHAWYVLNKAYSDHTNKKQRAKAMWHAIKGFRFNMDITAICHYVSYCYKQYRFPIAYNKPTSIDPRHIHAKLVWQNWNRLSIQQTRNVLTAIKHSTKGKQLHTSISLIKTLEAMLAGLYFVMHEAGIVAQQSCLDVDSVDANPQTAYYAKSAFNGTAQHHHYTYKQNIRRAYRQQRSQITFTRAIYAMIAQQVSFIRYNRQILIIHTLKVALAVEPRTQKGSISIKANRAKSEPTNNDITTVTASRIINHTGIPP